MRTLPASLTLPGRSMRRLALLLGLLALPSKAHAGVSYSGCGTTFGTCASAQIAAVQQADGSWQISVTVRNLSHISPQSSRSAFVLGVYLSGLTSQNAFRGITSIRGPNDEDLRSNFIWDETFDAQGLFLAGANGIVESIDDQGNPLLDTWTGIGDPQCAADPSCAGQRPASGPGSTFLYADGPVTFTFSVSQWTGLEGVTVETVLPDFSREQIALSQTVVVTPEPVSMVLLGTGLVGIGGAARRRRKGPAA